MAVGIAIGVFIVCIVAGLVWTCRDVWGDIGGIGDFFGVDEKDEETSSIDGEEGGGIE